jgi:phosphoserine phosphatase
MLSNRCPETEIILLDICGTLYRSNTTFDFLKYFFRNKRFPFLLILTFWSKPARLINKIVYNIIRCDIARTFLVGLLSGYSKEEISKKAAVFVNEVLETKQQYDVIDNVRKLQNKQNARLIIVSSTLDCIAAAVSNAFGIKEYYASELEYVDSICTGKIKNDLLDCKAQKLLERGIAPPFGMTISDNFTDIELMQRSAFSYIVSMCKHRRRWEKIINRYKLNNYEIIIV